jgi:CheY-like chemotaxis protein
MAHILIAEDDPVLRNLYVRKFTLTGYDIQTAENGEQALKVLIDTKPDIVILDIHMPVMDGIQVLEKLPKEIRPCPIIVLTNFGDDETRAKCTALQADDFFIKKDMTMKSLVEMVEKLLTAKGVALPKVADTTL